MPRRILTLILLLAMLFGCISCAKEEPYDPSLRLEVTSPDVSYGEAFTEESATRFASLFEKTMKVYKGINLSKAKKEEIRKLFSADILPLLQKIKAAPDDISALFDACEASLDGADFSFVTPYRKAVSLFGGDRAGKFFYEASALYLTRRAEECRARYETYGYSFFLRDAQNYERLRAELDTVLGEEGFCAAASMTTFIFSVISGQSTDGSLPTSAFGDAELLYILSYQGQYFEELAITEEGFRVFAALLSDLLPENENSLLEAELYALKKDAYFESAARAFPALISLYASATNRLLKDGAWQSDTAQDVKDAALCRALLDGTFPLENFLVSMEECAVTASDSEKEALRDCGAQDAFSAFLAENPPVSKDALLTALREIADGQGDGRTLSSLFFSYAVGVAPYFTFAISQSKS